MHATTFAEPEPQTESVAPPAGEAAAPEPPPASFPETPRRKRGLRAGLLLGLVTGLTGGTLLAPRAGEDLRRRVRQEASELVAHPEALPDRLRERIAALRRRAQGEAEATAGPGGRAETLRAAVRSIRDRIREALEQGREASREAQSRLRDEYRRMTGRQR